MKNMHLKDNVIKIEFPSSGKHRMREPIQRSNANCTAKHPSITEERAIHAESHNELCAILVADTDPTVISINEQPACIHYQLNGRKHRHYPDLLLYTKNEKRFIEVKTAEEANLPEVKERTSFMKKTLKPLGYNYHVHVESDYKREPRISNARHLHRKGYQKLNPEIKAAVLRTMSGIEKITLKALKKELEGFYENIIPRLILDGVLTIDLESVWTDETIVYFNGGVA